MIKIGTVVSEKIQFEFLYEHDLGPRSSNDLDLQYSHTFIYSIQRTIGPVNAHLISWPSKAQNIQDLENIR